MKFKNPKLSLFYLSQSLAFMYFWLAISIPYLLYRGLSTSEAFSLMAIYQFFGVILEYPTGVVGDRFGYRKMMYLANTLMCLAMFIMALRGGYYLYLAALLILAIGNGFSSGNDMGILKSISQNPKKDTANYNSLMDLVLFFSSVIGGLISKYSFELALIISGICMLSANIPLYLLRNGINQSPSLHSFFTIVKDGIKSLKNVVLRQLFILVAIVGGYSFTIKSIFGSFGELYHIDVASIGLIIGLGGLARSIGAKLYAELQYQNIISIIVALGISIIAIGYFPSYLVVVIIMLSAQILFGYALSKIDGDLHDLAHDHIRASLFSLKRLTMRLVASSYLLLYGYALGLGQHVLMMYGTGLVLLLSVALSWQYLTKDSC